MHRRRCNPSVGWGMLAARSSALGNLAKRTQPYGVTYTAGLAGWRLVPVQCLYFADHFAEGLVLVASLHVRHGIVRGFFEKL